MTYKDVCGSESCVWFELSDMKKEGRKFLQWAKRHRLCLVKRRRNQPTQRNGLFPFSYSF